MKKQRGEANYGGIGVFGLLGVVFVTLKLTHYIDWSWWYVTLPFWGMFAFIAVGALVGWIVYLIADGIQAKIAKNERNKRALTSRGVRRDF